MEKFTKIKKNPYQRLIEKQTPLKLSTSPTGFMANHVQAATRPSLTQAKIANKKHIERVADHSACL